MNKEINLLDLIIKILKHRWFILKTIFIITLISLILSLIWPKSYKSTVRFFPPPRQSSGLTGLLSGFFQPIVKTSEINPEAILVILKSRSLMEETIKKFNFADIYGNDRIEILMKKFESNIQINEIREGGFGFNPLLAVEFSFIDDEPQRAEAVTEFYINKLDSILKNLNKERALQTFKVIERRYLQNLNDLKKAEEALKAFQQKYGIFEIETQTQELIRQVAELKSQLIQTEIQLEILDQTIYRDSPQYLQLLNQKEAIENKYRELLEKTENKSGVSIFQPLENIPDLAISYARLYREVTVQNKVYEFIYPQYEQAKLQTEVSGQGLQILDPAKLPTYKYKPKRAFIVLAGLAFSIFFSLAIVFFKEYYGLEREKNSENYQKIRLIIEDLKTIFRLKM